MLTLIRNQNFGYRRTFVSPLNIFVSKSFDSSELFPQAKVRMILSSRVVIVKFSKNDSKHARILSKQFLYSMVKWFFVYLIDYLKYHWLPSIFLAWMTSRSWSWWKHWSSVNWPHTCWFVWNSNYKFSFKIQPWNV